MTEQTVPVPVELLKSLDTAMKGSAWHTVADSAPSLGVATSALTAFIPAPPRVGDVIATDEAARDLPAGTVLRDNIGDVWFVTPGGMFYVNPSRAYPAVMRIDGPAFDDYKPVIISLPEESK